MVYGLNERVKTLARPYCKADHLGNAGGQINVSFRCIYPYN